MTVSSNIARWDYTQTGVVTTYPFTAEIYTKNDLKVYVSGILKVVDTHYTISAGSIENPSGGNVVFTAGNIPALNAPIAIILDLPITQLVDYREGDAFPAETHERALDRAIKIIQSLQSYLRHVPKLSVESTIDLVMPDPSANRYIGWNAAATNLENKIDPVVIPVAGTEYVIDALISFGSGTDYTKATIDSALTAIGTVNLTTLLLRPGTWLIDDFANYSNYSNVNFQIPSGAYFSVDAGKILSLPGPSNIIAQPNQHIFTGSGTVNFANVDGIISVKWFGAIGDGVTDDTTAITNAINSRIVLPHIPDTMLYTYSTNALLFPGGTYLVTDTITPNYGAGLIFSNDRAVIYCSDDAKDIFDFNGGYVIHINGLKFSGGNRQIYFGNANLSNAQLYLEDVEFHHSHANAIEFYLVAPATNLSTVCVLDRCTFNDTYGCIETVPGVATFLNDSCVTIGYVDLTGRAAFVNKNQMVFRGMYGVPPGNLTHTGARWVDNYGDFIATQSRFGGEGSGMPVVYQYDVTRYYNVGGGAVDLKSNSIVCGDSSIQNTIIHLMTGIPQRITIKDNDWISKSVESDFISVDAGFDIATYIGALAAEDRIFIDVGNNAAWVPLELIGLPELLTDTDKTKVIVSPGFKPFIKGYTKKALLHFDGPNTGTTIVDEYLNQGGWTVVGDAQLSTSVKRFGRSSLALDGTGDYVTNTTTTSLGSAFTIEGWWGTSDNTKQDQMLVHAANGSGYGLILSYNPSASTHMALYVSSNGTTWNIASAEAGAATFSNNTWYKWVIEFNGSAYKVYIGTAGTAVTQDISVTSSSVPCAITSVNLGNGTQGGLAEFRMLIGDYRYGGLFMPESEPFNVD